MPPSSDNNATPGPSSRQRGSAASGAKTGEKRGADDRDSPLDDDSEATTKKARRAGVRAKKNQYGLAKVQIPPQFKGTKVCGHSVSLLYCSSLTRVRRSRTLVTFMDTSSGESRGRILHLCARLLALWLRMKGEGSLASLRL